MENTNEKQVTLINELIEINNDRIEGYERAMKETEDVDLKALFSSMAGESRSYRSELIAEVIRLHGSPAEGTKNSGKIYRAWMDIKAALTGKDRHAILASCEFGEDAAKEAYDDVLTADTALSSQTRDIIVQQREKLQQAHNKIKMMRDASKEIKSQTR